MIIIIFSKAYLAMQLPAGGSTFCLDSHFTLAYMQEGGAYVRTVDRSVSRSDASDVITKPSFLALMG